MQPLVDKLDQQNILNYIVLTTSKEYKNIKVKTIVLYINPILWRFMKGNIILTSNSGVSAKLINGFQTRIHSFHSPISVLRIYPDNAFDAFNTFFISGKHHDAELKYLFEKRKLPAPITFETGYMRIESFYKFNQNYKKKLHGRTIIIAPSWGEFNIINLFGYDIIFSLLDAGFNVILRPHPGNEIYNTSEIAKIRKGFDTHPKFYYDSWDRMDLICESDILIGDWSGISFEFALALNRPVIFIDTQPKDNHGSPSSFDLFEEYAREKVGRVICENSMKDIANIVNGIFVNYEAYKENIRENKADLIFNCPESSDSIFECVSNLARETLSSAGELEVKED